MAKGQRLSVGTFLFLFISACSSSSNPYPEITVPVANSPVTSTSIGDPGQKFEVLGKEAYESKNATTTIIEPNSERGTLFLKGLATQGPIDSSILTSNVTTTSQEGSLTLGFPKSLLNEQQVFGGVITKVSDLKSELLGGLKLSDLTPSHVRALVVSSKDAFTFVLAGCLEQCSESSPQKALLSIPIIGVDDKKGLIFIDLAAIGDKLNLVEQFDPKGEYTKLKTKTSKTVSFDHSLSTLVFDNEIVMVPLEPVAGQPETETKFTVRWYLKLASGFDPAFTSRTATPGVGFFMTERALTSVIQRWHLPYDESGDENSSLIKYYIKNVPTEYHDSFKGAFDEWNETFVKVIGRKLLDYEFVGVDDPKGKLLVPGDIRYRILEWDLENAAGYGGLGPSIANQFTGEMLSANVLIQGPKILELYKKWFKVSKEAENLRVLGRNAAAEQLLVNSKRELIRELSSLEGRKISVSVGENLPFNIRFQEPSLEDPVMQKDDFEPLPVGISFANYMNGYFHDLVAHEMGHNLGLRHNFRGNLGATEGAPQLGKVSVSIMEYLGRGFRYLDRIGTYDQMALAYGYAGKFPEVTNAFCTDENVPNPQKPALSAECSRDDATSDPFSFFEARLTRILDLLTERKSQEAPVWAITDVERETTTAINNLGFYALSAASESKNWTNFFGKPGRPSDSTGVKGYALNSILKQVCDASLITVAESKPTVEAKEKVLTNVKALQAKVADLLGKQGFTIPEVSCQ